MILFLHPLTRIVAVDPFGVEALTAQRRLQQVGNTSSTYTQFLPTSILVLRLGGTDVGVNASAASPGTAVPVSIDSYSVTQNQTVLTTTAFPTAYNQFGVGNNLCTLASGSIGTWLYDADGMPSNTQVRWAQPVNRRNSNMLFANLCDNATYFSPLLCTPYPPSQDGNLVFFHGAVRCNNRVIARCSGREGAPADARA